MLNVLLLLTSVALSTDASCPPPDAVEILAGLVGGRPKAVHGKSLFVVETHAPTDRIGISVPVIWKVEPNLKGGSNISGQLKASYDGRAAQAAAARAKEWAQQMLSTAVRKCAQTNWSEQQAALAYSETVQNPVAVCGKMGGILQSSKFEKVPVCRNMTFSDRGLSGDDAVTTWRGSTLVGYCTLGDVLHGPLVIRSRDGSVTHLSAFYQKGWLHGRMVERSANTSNHTTDIREFNHGASSGEWLSFDEESGAPTRFRVFSDDGDLVGCAGRCAAYSDTPYLGPDAYHRYPSHSTFLSKMEAAREKEQAEIAAERAARERWVQERQAADAARRARTEKAGEQAARLLAFDIIGRKCSDVWLGVRSLSGDGWYHITGRAACPEHIEFMDKTILLQKRFSIELSVDEDGSWTKRQEYYNDP